jgi:hypothetical protein
MESAMRHPTVPHLPRSAASRVRGMALACAVGTLLPLSGCYYYYPYGYGYGAYPGYPDPAGYPAYTSTVPAAATQQETTVGTTAPNAVPDAQYPGPLYPSPPVAIAVPAYPVYPGYYSGWGWGAPAVSFGFGYWR